jgi:hypothetical protein
MTRKDNEEAFRGGAAVTAALVIGGVILLAMIGVSWYGAVTLPAGARVPIHFGISYNNFVPKRAGLVIHPALGALVFLIIGIVSRGKPAAGPSSHGAPTHIILPIIMGVLLVVQIGAIMVARRRSGA